jgi:hypothetical protein
MKLPWLSAPNDLDSFSGKKSLKIQSKYLGYHNHQTWKDDPGVKPSLGIPGDYSQKAK